MFYYVNGTLAALEGGIAVVDCGGVGYMCNVCARTEAKLGQSLGKTVKLYTYLSVREDAMELFGFGDRSELSMFKLLISVSGVGARTALAILGAVTPEKFAYAVSVGDVKSIKAPGVGPKIAARIILELKDKISKDFVSDGDGLDAAVLGASAPAAPQSNKLTEARTALMALGFTKSEAEGLMRKIDCTRLSVEDIIREALKQLNS
ncbi:MAG: Holliday junction branch migration protein RuvA [Clostridia bacterium]|nr:Holliday junction branch migration protein RuvA [Clostridia bacterium]